MIRKKKPSGVKIGEPRSVKNLRRFRGNRKPGKVIVLVCEGEKTEPGYFNSLKNDLKLHTLDIKVIPGQGAPISIIDRAIIEKRSLSKDDEVWGIFDVEVVQYNASFNKAVDKAKQNKIGLAISNPSFEYWYILHYERTNKPFQNPNEVISHLKKYLPKYQKNLCIYSDIQELTDDAIENANLLRSSSADDWSSYPNSSTTVDLLIQKIRQFGE